RPAHLVKDDVPQYAGIVDKDVGAAEGVERRFDDRFRVFRLGNRERGKNRLASGFSYGLDSLLRRARVRTLSLQGDADIATPPPRALLSEQDGNGAPNTTPASGYDGGFAFDDSGMRMSQRQTLPHTSSASSTIIRSFAHCSSSPSTLPSSVEAKPHCGDRHNCSSGTNLVASSMPRLMSSFGSSRPLFEVTRPSTPVRSFGSIRNGSNPPARAVSYSMKNPCTLILLKRISCTAS